MGVPGPSYPSLFLRSWRARHGRTPRTTCCPSRRDTSVIERLAIARSELVPLACVAAVGERKVQRGLPQSSQPGRSGNPLDPVTLCLESRLASFLGQIMLEWVAKNGKRKKR